MMTEVQNEIEAGGFEVTQRLQGQRDENAFF